MSRCSHSSSIDIKSPANCGWEKCQNQKWAPDNRTIDVLVGRLRKKIEPDPSHPDWIITIHGEGYMLAEISDR